MIDQSVSKQQAIHAVLRQEILGQRWFVGDRLPTEAELAKRFECSIGTISKAVALLVHEGLVERKTKLGTRVLRNSEESDTAKLDAFAFIYPSDKHEGIWRMVSGFQDAARDVGRRTVTLSTGADYQKESEFLSRLAEFDVKGAVIHPVIRTPKDHVDLSQVLVNSKFPIVLADVNLPGLGVPTVLSDGLHAGYAVTRHLLGRGLKKVGFLANNALNHSVRDKYLGFRQAMDEAGIGEAPENVLLDPVMTPRYEDTLREPVEIARVYLQEHPDLEGVVCVNDFFAHGLLIAARELGISVPKKMKVVGVNDLRLLPPQSPSLTTYRVPYEEIGKEAFRILNRLVENKKPERQEVMLRGELVVRESA